MHMYVEAKYLRLHLDHCLFEAECLTDLGAQQSS